MVSTVHVINTLTVINFVSFYVSVLWPWFFPCRYTCNHNHQFDIIMNKNIMSPWVCHLVMVSFTSWTLAPGRFKGQTQPLKPPGWGWI